MPSLNFDFPSNKEKDKNENSLNVNKNKTLNIPNIRNKFNKSKNNDVDLKTKIDEFNNNFINNNNKKINKNPGININDFKEERKINNEKLTNEINSIQKPIIENPIPYQNVNEGKDKILKEIEKLNKEILNMQNEETKNNFKDRLNLIQNENLDTFISPIKQEKNNNYSNSDFDFSNNIKTIENYRNTNPNVNLLENFNEEEDYEELPKKISPLGLVYPEKPRNSNNIIKKYINKNNNENDIEFISSYNNYLNTTGNLLRGTNKNLNLNKMSLNEKNLMRLKNLRLNYLNNENDSPKNKTFESNVIYPINEIPIDLRSPFTKVFNRRSVKDIHNYKTIETEKGDVNKKKIIKKLDFDEQ